MTAAHRFGTVAIVGRPNVGKSTLLNALVGERVSIVTAKAQTTRNRITGIRTGAAAQMVFLDTPGVTAHGGGLNRRLRRIAEMARAEADVCVIVLDVRRGVGPIEEALLGEAAPARTVVVLNKVDAVPKSTALPVLAQVARLLPDAVAIPISARTGVQLPVLVAEIERRLPPGEAIFGADDFTTASVRFLAQEIIREQVFLQTRAEVPYDAAVVVEAIRPEGDLTWIDAVVLVANDRHKGMLIGAGGARVKAIGTAARPNLETLLGGRVHLALQVKAEPGWLASPDRLDALELT